METKFNTSRKHDIINLFSNEMRHNNDTVRVDLKTHIQQYKV